MKQKTRILIYILIGIAVVIIGTIAILTNSQSGTPVSAQEKIDLGRVYLVELSYDKAVVEFTEAIEIEPMNADAYLGLAEAYMGLNNIDEAIEVLETGYERTGDRRLKDKLDEILPPEPEETTVTTTAATTVTTTETTVTEEIKPETETTSEIIFSGVPTYFSDKNASYTIDVISGKEAHIEIFSEGITSDYAMGYVPELNDNTATLHYNLVFDDYIEIGVRDWNFADKNIWTWSNAHPQIFVLDGNGSGHDLGYLYNYNISYNISCNADTEHNKISFDVTMPDELDFSFNNYKSAELNVYYYRYNN